jgi:large subunit ribosomal protein L4
MSKLPLKSIKGESVGEYEFADHLLVLDKGDQAVHEAVVAYQAHQRAGTASTLSKSNVSGTGAKPWKQLAFRRAFSAKVEQGEVTVLDALALSAPKTREIAAVLGSLGLERGALFIVDAADDNLLLAARNIPRVEVATAALVNTYQLLRHRNVVVTKAGMEALESRLG